jgi:hypothetical protein
MRLVALRLRAQYRTFLDAPREVLKRRFATPSLLDIAACAEKPPWRGWFPDALVNELASQVLMPQPAISVDVEMMTAFTRSAAGRAELKKRITDAVSAG